MWTFRRNNRNSIKYRARNKKNTQCKTIRDLPMTSKEIKEKAKTDIFITEKKKGNCGTKAQ